MKPDAFETAVREALAQRAAEVPAAAGDRLRRGSYPLRRRRYGLRGGHYPLRGGPYPLRPRGWALVAAGAGLALAAGLATAAVTDSGSAGPAPGAAAQGHATLAADFLARAAAAARAQSGPASRSGQIYYVKELELSSGVFGGGQECWIYAQPAPLTDGPIFSAWRFGPTVRATCADAPVPSAASLTKPAPLPSKVFKSVKEKLQYLRSHPFPPWRFLPLTEHAYPPISSLPTNPAALQAALGAAAGRDSKSGVNIYDQYEFDYVNGDPAATHRDILIALIDRLMRAPISGELRAALYEVIAGLPDVRLIPHVRDALGRYGTEVMITVPQFWYPEKYWMVRASDTGKPVRATNGGIVCAVAAEGPQQSGFILDPHTYRYLGDTSSLTTTTGSGRGCEQKFYRNTSAKVGAVLEAGFAAPQGG